MIKSACIHKPIYVECITQLLFIYANMANISEYTKGHCYVNNLLVLLHGLLLPPVLEGYQAWFQVCAHSLEFPSMKKGLVIE